MYFHEWKEFIVLHQNFGDFAKIYRVTDERINKNMELMCAKHLVGYERQFCA